MKDLYQILGVDRGASDDDIKRAYRRMASQHHPDKGGDKERFQEIQQAYSILSDPEQRQQYDNPGIRVNFNSGPHFNFNDIFEMFGARFHAGADMPQRRAMRLQLWITIVDVMRGGPRIVALTTAHGQSTAEIHIPPGIADGDTVRYNAVGPGGSDILATFRVRPDARYQRQNNNIIMSQTLDFWQLILGCTVNIKTPDDRCIALTVSPDTQPGTMLRIRAHGIPDRDTGVPGDLLVQVQARLPDQIPPALRDQIRQISGT